MSKDTIYRQDAIDAVSKACFELRGVFGRCEDALNALPSAQPETCAYWDSESNLCALHRPSAQPFSEEEVIPQIIRCKECRFYEIFPNGANGKCKLNVDVEISFYPWDFCSHAERRQE